MATLITAAATVGLTAAAGSCNITDGRILGSSDYHHQKTSDAGACCDLCAADAKCKAFTFVSELGKYHNYCYLKDNAQDQGAQGNRTSGVPPGVGPTPPHSACNNDHDCSLNGICDASGVCQCDTPWSGDTCGILITEKARAQGVYGYSPNISSWGGNIVQGDDGSFHLFVSEMTDGGLIKWGSECHCVHAVSPNISGPYLKADVAVEKWCHNAAPIRDPNGEYLLFHIGKGPASPSSGFMHHSSSPVGPWVPAKTSPGACNNPAPAFHPNGTLFLICNHMQITSARTWDEAWQPLRSLGKVGGDRDRHWEDPTLWFDRRGNFHILYHVYCLLPYSDQKECYSGHAFSADGFEWTFSDVEPFGGTVDFTDGTSVTFSTRERPQVIFAPGDATTPVGFVGGVSSQPIGPWCDSCYKNTCSQCKITKDRDWTYTVLQPLQGFNTAYPEQGRIAI